MPEATVTLTTAPRMMTPVRTPQPTLPTGTLALTLMTQGTTSDNVTDGGDDTHDANERGSDDPVVDDGSDAEPDPVVNEPDAGDDSDLIEDVVSEVSGAVRLVWDRPERRENGEFLEGDEIGGYELRYRRLGEEDVKTVIINDGWDEDYELGELVGSYQFSIAAFDNNGLYSEFVSLSPATGLVGSL